MKPDLYNEFHLFLIPKEWGGPQPNKYVSRYFGRDIDAHIIYLEQDCWMYVKFARFMLFSRITGTSHTFRYAQITFEGSALTTLQYLESEELSAYLVERAEVVYEHFQSTTSPTQIEVIRQHLQHNLEKINSSELGQRMIQDLKAEISPYVHDPSFKYLCDCCHKNMVAPEGFLLRTFEIIVSQPYWKFYFSMLGLTDPINDAALRGEYFIQIAGQEGPWTVCDQCIDMFAVDKVVSKEYMESWIAEKGGFFPPKCKNFREHVPQADLDALVYWLCTVSIDKAQDGPANT